MRRHACAGLKKSGEVSRDGEATESVSNWDEKVYKLRYGVHGGKRSEMEKMDRLGVGCAASRQANAAHGPVEERNGEFRACSAGKPVASMGSKRVRNLRASTRAIFPLFPEKIAERLAAAFEGRDGLRARTRTGQRRRKR